MRNLISGGSVQWITRHMDNFRDYGGVLAKPYSGNHPMRAVELGAPWAADNGCYVSYDRLAILKMLDKYREVPNCLFVNAPDVVCDHVATLRRFQVWGRIIQRRGYPVAFTLQNGVMLATVPWDDCQALFIGGDTAFKYSTLVAEIVAAAKARGKHIHMGRVNSISRITYARAIGVDSFDGTGYARNPKHIKSHYPFHSSVYHQPLLLEV